MEINSCYIGEEISVEFEKVPPLSKKPHCPNGFTWNGNTFVVTELLGKWRDYGRHGHIKITNPQHFTINRTVNHG